MNGNDQPAKVRGVRRAAYIALAALFLALGLLGVVLPGLPTTPFLLLTSYYLTRSSPWLHDKVMRIPFVGRPIRDWRDHRGVRSHVKATAYVTVFAVVAVTLASHAVITIKVITVSLAALGLGVVWRLPTLR